MSSFVVSDECMSVILAAVKKYADKQPIYFGCFNKDVILDWLGNNLLAFNWEAVNTRYKTDDPYTYRKLEVKELEDNFNNSILMFKQVECWKYQSIASPDSLNAWQYNLMDRLGELLCNDIMKEYLCMEPTKRPEDNAEIVKKTLAYYQCEMWG